MTVTLAFQLAIAGISVGSIYALVALAIVIPFKASGVLNFGQGDDHSAYIALVLTTPRCRSAGAGAGAGDRRGRRQLIARDPADHSRAGVHGGDRYLRDRPSN
jgi:hypothetical protein